MNDQEHDKLRQKRQHAEPQESVVRCGHRPRPAEREERQDLRAQIELVAFDKLPRRELARVVVFGPIQGHKDDRAHREKPTDENARDQANAHVRRRLARKCRRCFEDVQMERKLGDAIRDEQGRKNQILTRLAQSPLLGANIDRRTHESDKDWQALATMP